MKYPEYKFVEVINYKEDRSATDVYKQNYVEGLEKLIKRRQEKFCEERRIYCKDLFKNQDKYRSDLKVMLGWPLTEPRSEKIPYVKTEKLSEQGRYTIYRMQVEILDDVYMTGLFFRTSSDKRPFVIAQHGGVGTPERVAGFYGGTANYNDLIDRLLTFDCNVFAPQILVWGLNGYNEYNVECDRRGIDAMLKSVGSSITAVEVHGISRIIDYFEKQDFISGIGMAGHSYGGFYTLFCAALDERIKAAVSCSYFNTRNGCTWSDWNWDSSVKKFADAEVACLVYPRNLTVMMGTEDQTFRVKGAESEIERLEAMFTDVGTDWFESIIFEGKHEFYRDDTPLKKMIESLL